MSSFTLTADHLITLVPCYPTFSSTPYALGVIYRAPINLHTRMSLWCGRKLEHLEETHMSTGGTCKLHTRQHLRLGLDWISGVMRQQLYPLHHCATSNVHLLNTWIIFNVTRGYCCDKNVHLQTICGNPLFDRPRYKLLSIFMAHMFVPEAMLQYSQLCSARSAEERASLFFLSPEIPTIMQGSFQSIQFMW